MDDRSIALLDRARNEPFAPASGDGFHCEAEPAERGPAIGRIGGAGAEPAAHPPLAEPESIGCGPASTLSEEKGHAGTEARKRYGMSVAECWVAWAVATSALFALGHYVHGCFFVPFGMCVLPACLAILLNADRLAGRKPRSTEATRASEPFAGQEKDSPPGLTCGLSDDAARR